MLADRVAILVQGALQMQGSPMELKSQLSIGHLLTVETRVSELGGVCILFPSGVRRQTDCGLGSWNVLLVCWVCAIVQGPRRSYFPDILARLPAGFVEKEDGARGSAELCVFLPRGSEREFGALFATLETERCVVVLDRLFHPLVFAMHVCLGVYAHRACVNAWDAVTPWAFCPLGFRLHHWRKFLSSW